MIVSIPSTTEGVKNAVTEERLIFSSLFVLAAIIYIRSQNYPDNDALLPSLAALAIMVSIVLLVVKSIVLRAIGGELKLSTRFSDLGSPDFDMGESDENRISELSKDAMVPRVALMLSYPVLGFLIGLLWATPIFVLAYTIWTDQSKIAVVAFTVLSFLVVYAFDYLLNLPIRSGILIGGL